MLVFFSFLTVGPLGQPWSAFPEAESQDRAASQMSGKPGHEAEVAQESLIWTVAKLGQKGQGWENIVLNFSSGPESTFLEISLLFGNSLKAVGTNL